jgi:hypothetical protein
MDANIEKEKWSTLEEIKKKSAILSKMTMDELVETIKKYPQILELNNISLEESVGKNKKSKKTKSNINLNDVSNLFNSTLFFFRFYVNYLL